MAGPEFDKSSEATLALSDPGLFVQSGAARITEPWLLKSAEFSPISRNWIDLFVDHLSKRTWRAPAGRRESRRSFNEAHSLRERSMILTSSSEFQTGAGRRRAASKIGQFTLVYKCSMASENVPVFAIFRHAQRSSNAGLDGPQVQSSPEYPIEHSDLRATKTGCGTCHRNCQGSSPLAFTMFSRRDLPGFRWLFWPVVAAPDSYPRRRALPRRGSGDVPRGSIRTRGAAGGNSVEWARLRCPQGLAEHSDVQHRNETNRACVRRSSAADRSTASDARDSGAVRQDKGGPLDHDPHGTAEIASLRHLCVTSTSPPHHLANQLSVKSYCGFPQVPNIPASPSKSKRRNGMAQIMGDAGPKSFIVLICTVQRSAG